MKWKEDGNSFEIDMKRKWNENEMQMERKWNGMKKNEMEWRKMKWKEGKWNGIKENEMEIKRKRCRNEMKRNVYVNGNETLLKLKWKYKSKRYGNKTEIGMEMKC